MVSITSHFVGEGWHLTLGVLFMVVVIFLPGGIMEGVQRIMDRKSKHDETDSSAVQQTQGEG